MKTSLEKLGALTPNALMLLALTGGRRERRHAQAALSRKPAAVKEAAEANLRRFRIAAAAEKPTKK